MSTPINSHCRNGHEYTAENVYRIPGRNDRQCRACARVRRGQRTQAEYMAARYPYLPAGPRPPKKPRTPRKARPEAKAAIEALLVQQPNGCRIWSGWTNRDGYGIFSKRVVHRVYYEIVVGPIPDGLTIDHLCRNRACVNPEHMEPVTNEENVMRGESFAAVNARKTHCVNGHPYDLTNTYIRPGTGHRDCLACTKARKRERRFAADAVGSGVSL